MNIGHNVLGIFSFTEEKAIPVLNGTMFSRLHSVRIPCEEASRAMHQSTTPSLSQTLWRRWASRQFFSLPIVQTLLSVTLGYFLSAEVVIMRQLRGWKRLWRRSLTRSHKRTFMGPSRCCWNDTTSVLQLEAISSKGTRVSCVYYQ